MNKINLIIGCLVVVLLFGLGTWTGWSLHKTLRPCPTITTDTVAIQDPYWHHIADSLAGLSPIEKIKWLPQDTLYVPGDTILTPVDTAAILKDYFSVYVYNWENDDDTLSVKLKTTVTENKPIAYDLKYKVLPPFTTVINNIDNSLTYHKYLQFGADIPLYRYKTDSTTISPINRVSLELNYVFPKGYAGVGWRPYDNTISARLGTTIFKFKQIK